ncbi:hypothetical protein GQ53DRAFT_741023 [Thozetella sp. PMI_491]|nr:hypothetical protein GQ53DRAFT_741023 [Thozetella sp. PMI_491]
MGVAFRLLDGGQYAPIPLADQMVLIPASYYYIAATAFLFQAPPGSPARGYPDATQALLVGPAGAHETSFAPDGCHPTPVQTAMPPSPPCPSRDELSADWGCPPRASNHNTPLAPGSRSVTKNKRRRPNNAGT